MTIFRSKVAFFSILWCLGMGSPIQAQTSAWTFGQEREVDEGVYMTLLETFSGWRLWKIETRSGVECRAIKSAVGRPHPIPVGAGAVFYRGTPFLQIMPGYREPFRFSWETVHWGKVKVQFREQGEKFWESLEPNSNDLTHLDGKKIEIHLTSWEYPEILVGFAEEKAVIDLSGMSQAMSKIDECLGRTKP